LRNWWLEGSSAAVVGPHPRAGCPGLYR